MAHALNGRVWWDRGDDGSLGVILKWGRTEKDGKSVPAWGFMFKNIIHQRKGFTERYYGYWGQIEIGNYMFRTYWPRGHLQYKQEIDRELH